MEVTIRSGHYVPDGTVLSSQADADRLPQLITEDYAFKWYSKANFKL